MNVLPSKKVIAGITALGIMASSMTSCVIPLWQALSAPSDQNQEDLLGVALFGFAGYGAIKWAASKVKDKSSYDNMEDYVNDNIEQLDTRTAEAVATKNELSQKVAAIKSGRSKKLTTAQLQSQKSTMATHISLIDTDILVAKDAVNEASADKRQVLQSKIDTLSAVKREYEQNMDALSVASRI